MPCPRITNSGSGGGGSAFAKPVLAPAHTGRHEYGDLRMKLVYEDGKPGVAAEEALPVVSSIPCANLRAPVLCAGALPLSNYGLPGQGFLHDAPHKCARPSPKVRSREQFLARQVRRQAPPAERWTSA